MSPTRHCDPCHLQWTRRGASSTPNQSMQLAGPTAAERLHAGAPRHPISGPCIFPAVIYFHSPTSATTMALTNLVFSLSTALLIYICVELFRSVQQRRVSAASHTTFHCRADLLLRMMKDGLLLKAVNHRLCWTPDDGHSAWSLLLKHSGQLAISVFCTCLSMSLARMGLRLSSVYLGPVESTPSTQSI